mmetsp:Transcript_97045/g.296598  ORF Transcript_97045/g.296598 Transcript_97045/m.296598 type:complete len:132 (+) Transcript_97045:702-1097(+)
MGTERPHARGSPRTKSTHSRTSRALSAITSGATVQSWLDVLFGLDRVPAGQDAHAVPCLNVLAGQSMQAALPGVGICPGGHALQDVAPCEPPQVEVAVPGAHGWHRVAPMTLEYLPAGHARHEPLTDRSGW